MDPNFSADGKAKVKMINYLKGVITDFLKIITGSASSLSADYLLIVRPKGENKMLVDKGKMAFNHCVTQLRFAYARLRKDIQPAVAFLTTMGEEHGRRQLGESKEGVTILQRINKHAHRHQVRWPRRDKMVGRHIIGDTR
jgi:hypothetical protein